MATTRKSAKKPKGNTVLLDDRKTELIQQKKDALAECVDLNRVDPQEGLRRILEIVQWAEDNHEIGLKAQALLYATDSCRFLGGIDEIRHYMVQVESLIDNIEDLNEREWVMSSLGGCYVRLDEWRTGLKLLQQALEMSIAQGKPARKRFQTYHSMAIAFFKAGAYEEALEYNLLMIEHYQDDDPVLNRAQSLVNIGTVYGCLRDFSKALECYERAVALSTEGQYNEGIIIGNLNIGDCFMEQKHYAEALPYLENALRDTRVLGERSYIIETLSALCNCHLQLGNTEKALALCLESLEAAVDAGEEFLYASALRMKGEIMMRSGDLDSALRAFLEALELGRKYEQPEHDLEVHESLAAVYDRMGDFRQSCEYRKKVFDIYQTIAGVERQQAAGAIELKYAMLAEQQEREILRLRAEKAEQQSQMKTRELNALALKLTQRNEALKSLRKIIEPYVKEGKGAAKSFAMDVQRSFESVVDMDAEWKQFQEQFERVHQDFTEMLRATCSELTATEVRICILIRLNLSSKQIAETLSLSPLTIKTHRANIRRKLGLEDQNNLTSFLMAI